MNNKVMLMILDGWGINPNPKVSAIAAADTPFIDSCFAKYPNATLTTYGLDVGLPEGQMGNSEVGHMNLGAGRVVYQNLVRINMAVQDKSFLKENVLNSQFQFARDNNKKVHFIGLTSNGGVHSHINHLYGLLEAAAEYGLTDNVYVHAFTDGRDCDPQSGKKFLEDLEEQMTHTTGKLASVIGRYYAMDRDKRWERVKLAYDLLVKGIGKNAENVVKTIEESYEDGITDEFLKPIILDKNGLIEEGDIVINFNFRTDRGREITQVLTQDDFPEFGMQKLSLRYITLTNYDKTFQGIEVVYDENEIPNTLGEVLEKAGKTQIRIAETEKYPHVTFFFSGGREKPFEGERRILCPSPKEVPTYDLKPEMSAFEITKNILPEIKNQSADFICLNFANTDMVGHTGVFQAAVKAAETVDQCTESIVKTALENEYTVIILADHGNADMMVNPDGSPNTQHSTNLVPVILIQNEKEFEINDGKLGDIAPTILKLMDVKIPVEMTGNILLRNN
ncbi:2,3-bisphosphoglycerate-independent phosphoglycerate mutase [Moheibacter lacus]|uniref:2,3-bisphosphoglycerate-independent phosphoglycerate mutase n=1 Tax=Moheibacter lacus TaxID=2745851 RepID=A0A838ZRV2_9FLAO|nr:2,3-bisphosphoglycerate-independent phosphoglycerate mutase [Moheibacter lacus]MBA5629363.1 2,3-bisphosphoglycerate-independent phosphoglycerate mutase [Moheibacter lacus]